MCIKLQIFSSLVHWSANNFHCYICSQYWSFGFNYFYDDLHRDTTAFRIIRKHIDLPNMNCQNIVHIMDFFNFSSATVTAINTGEVWVKRSDGNKSKLYIAQLQKGKYTIRHVPYWSKLADILYIVQMDLLSIYHTRRSLPYSTSQYWKIMKLSQFPAKCLLL